jgi:DNA-binding LacI/PurR family transcriptional regulator
MGTLKDISKLTGYSLSTISKALNGYSDVSEKTKEAIISAAEKLNYYPDYEGHKLQKRDTKTIALIIRGLADSNQDGDPVISDIIKGVAMYSLESDIDMALYHLSNDRQRDISYYKFCRSRNIDGAILLGFGMNDPYIIEAKNTSYPIVLFDAFLKNSSTNYGSVTIDNVKMAQQATQYLIDTGHQTIAFINGRKEAQVSILREEGYRSAMLKAFKTIDESLIEYGDFMQKRSYNVALKLLQTRRDIDAIFCASDMMATGVYEAARELGLAIPENLSVIGFDGIPLSKYIQPSLTTVKQDFVKMAYKSAELLRNIVYLHEPSATHLVEAELIIRESTTPRGKAKRT